SAPKIIIQILITGTQIFGKALLEAARQAAKNAKHRPQGVIGSDVAGVGNATSGSLTDKLTREHRMTLDEAHLILNTKRTESIEQILQNYEHLFKANAPPEVPPTPAPRHSHYLQSKVVRARERIEAEMKVASEEPPSRPP
ncbi:Pam16-domain-containing protein, partial [Russula compacta]